MDERSGVQSLTRAFSLLEALSEQPAGAHLQELVSQTGLHKSTVHRLLASMISLGYVKKVAEEEGKYRLTLKLFEIGGRIASNIDVTSICRIPLERLRNQVQEAVHLIVRDGCDGVYVQKWESQTNSYQMFSRIGMQRPLYCTAAGKSILSLLSDREVAQIWNNTEIKAYTENTITNLEQLYGELDEIRQQGYALDNQENELGVRCVAAPIRDTTGQSQSAFSISAPIIRMSDDRIQEMVPILLETARTISRELGYHEDANA